MREAYYCGAPGVISSGTAWFVAGLVAVIVSPTAGILTLLLGGMLIFPISIVFCRLIGASGKHKKENPLAALAIEGTFGMLISIPIAAGLAFYRIEWFFPAMLFVIGGRYLTFSTLYGRRLYWAFAVILVITGWLLLATNAPVFSGAFTGAFIEYFFGVMLFIFYKREQANKPSKSDAASGAS